MPRDVPPQGLQSPPLSRIGVLSDRQRMAMAAAALLFLAGLAAVILAGQPVWVLVPGMALLAAVQLSAAVSNRRNGAAAIAVPLLQAAILALAILSVFAWLPVWLKVAALAPLVVALLALFAYDGRRILRAGKARAAPDEHLAHPPGDER